MQQEPTNMQEHVFFDLNEILVKDFVPVASTLQNVLEHPCKTIEEL